MTNPGDSTDGLLLTSGDGTVAFFMLPTSDSLVVEKRSSPSTGQRMAQVIAFENASQFDRWCDNEPIRFVDPMLYDRLRRQGHDLLKPNS